MTRFVGGIDGRVFAVGPGVRPLGIFKWGGQSTDCALLAKRLLHEVTKDDARATRLYRRFLHRAVAIWPAGRPWTQTDAEILAIIAEIETVEKETAKDRAKMARELPRGGTGFGGVGIAGVEPEVWDKNPDIVRNDPDKAQRQK